MTAGRSPKALESKIRQLESQIVKLERSNRVLIASRKRNRSIVEIANSIILRADTRGIITFVNQFAQKFFGFTESELVGRPAVGTIVPQTDSDGRDMAELVQQLIENPERFIANEGENLLKNGERVWIAWTTTTLRDEKGNTVEILAIGNDITQRKRMEDKLRAHELQLEEKTRYLSEVNQALKTLLDQREVEKRSIEETMLAGIRKLVFPYIEQLRDCKLNGQAITYLDIIKLNLEDLVSPLGSTRFAKYLEFTPAEILVADHIRQGKSSKQIAASMRVSTSSISFHRYNIRKKMGLLNKSINLETYLNSIPN